MAAAKWRMTFFESAGQPTAFLLLLAAGFSTAVLYDGLRLMRRRTPRWMQAALDAAWCLAAAVSCLTALAVSGERQLRLYALLGLACGAGLYCLGLRMLLRAAWRGLRRLKKQPQSASVSAQGGKTT